MNFHDGYRTPVFGHFLVTRQTTGSYALSGAYIRLVIASEGVWILALYYTAPVTGFTGYVDSQSAYPEQIAAGK